MSTDYKGQDDMVDDVPYEQNDDHIHKQSRRWSLKVVKDDLVMNRMIYFMAASAAFGGMFFGWVCTISNLGNVFYLTYFFGIKDTGLIGGILS